MESSEHSDKSALILITRHFMAIINALISGESLTSEDAEFLEQYRIDSDKGDPNYTDASKVMLRRSGMIKSGRY